MLQPDRLPPSLGTDHQQRRTSLSSPTSTSSSITAAAIEHHHAIRSSTCNRPRAFAVTGDLFAPDSLSAYHPGTLSAESGAAALQLGAPVEGDRASRPLGARVSVAPYELVKTLLHVVQLAAERRHLVSPVRKRRESKKSGPRRPRSGGISLAPQAACRRSAAGFGAYPGTQR